MTRLTARKKNRKKPSEFQKFWTKAEKLKQQNARFRGQLDKIIQRIQTEVRPAEEKAALQHIPLLKCLITLGQRKSLTQWQRQTLDDWIQEILEPLQHTSHLDSELEEDISRYEAFRLGIELDECTPTPVAEQLRMHIERENAQLEEERKARDEAWHADVFDIIENILNQTLGPEPPLPEEVDNDTGDFFQDELQQEWQRVYEAYHKIRDAARKKLLAEILENSAPWAKDDENNFFDSDFDPFATDDPFPKEPDDNTPAISNTVFKKLFRSTAAVLHPDREHDPDMREIKHRLMTKLLNARKQGDVMTMIQMHQKHAGDGNALSKADEKQLIKALKAQVDELQQERETYSFESPLHRMAYELFYYPSTKKTEQAFKQHLRQLETAASEALSLSQSIKTLKALKPHLEQRYDARSSTCDWIG